jgi:hypothetical protein
MLDQKERLLSVMKGDSDQVGGSTHASALVKGRPGQPPG